MIFHLFKFAHLHKPVDFVVGEAEGDSRGGLKIALVGGVDVRLLVLGETESEYCAMSAPIDDQGSIAARAAGASARDPLLDNAAAKLGVDKPTFRPRHRLI
jgi:hypothetical protein